ncbi:MAG: type VI secretion system-associated FHA domain protein TagH [Steroidobacteraceae bacterium]
MLLALSVISGQGANLGSAAYKIFDEQGGSIGRLDSNDWALPDPERFVSSRHAVVRFQGDAFCLEDVSTNGTFINGPDLAVSKSEPVRLKDGDRLFIGDYEIMVQLIEGSARAPGRGPVPIQTPPPGTALGTEDPLAVIGVGASSAAPAPAAAPASAAAPALDRSARDLLTALGLNAREVAPDVAAQLGAIVRVVIQGMLEVLHARAEVKSNFRMPMTSVRVVENNPLKFSLDADDALHNLFVKRNPGYLGPLEAFKEGFQDIACHELAMLAGIRAAYQSMVAKFSPAQLEESYAGNVRRTSVLPIGGRTKLWDMYCAQFGNIEKDGEASFQLLFGEEFAKAYHRQLERLSRAAKSEKKQTGA